MHPGTTVRKECLDRNGLSVTDAARILGVDRADLERIYIGRRFRNDTERLENLFDLYTKMTAAAGTKPARRARA